jgi:hypothetical protein
LKKATIREIYTTCQNNICEINQNRIKRTANLRVVLRSGAPHVFVNPILKQAKVVKQRRRKGPIAPVAESVST